MYQFKLPKVYHFKMPLTKVGLRRVGQQFIDKSCNKGDSLYKVGSYENAHSVFSLVDDYIKSSRKVGVELQWTAKHKISDPTQQIINNYIKVSEFEKDQKSYIEIGNKYFEVRKKYEKGIKSGLCVVWPSEYDSLYLKSHMRAADRLCIDDNHLEAVKLYQDINNLFPSDSRALEKKNRSLDKIVKKFYDSIMYNFKAKKYDQVIYDYNNLSDIIKSYSTPKRHTIQDSIEKIYIDTKNIIALIEFEKKFQLAENFLKNKKYRSAYDLLEKLDIEKPGYKNLKLLLNEAKNKAIIRVGFLPFRNSANCVNISGEVSSNTFKKLLGESNRYIKYFDRANLADIIEEQALSMTGIVDEETAIKAGKIAGLNFMVLGKINSCFKDESTQPIQVITAYNVTSRDFYEQYYKEVYNFYTQQNEYVTCQIKTTRYYGTPANVTIYKGFKKMVAKVEILVINIETAEILGSEYIDSEKSDDIKYADCGGSD